MHLNVPLMVFSLQGDRVIGVSGFNGMAEECIIDQKVSPPRNIHVWRFFSSSLVNFHPALISCYPSFPLLCICFSAKHFLLSNAKPIFVIGVTTLAQSFVCMEWYNEEGHFVFWVLEQWTGWLSNWTIGSFGRKTGLRHWAGYNSFRPYVKLVKEIVLGMEPAWGPGGERGRRVRLYRTWMVAPSGEQYTLFPTALLR